MQGPSAFYGVQVNTAANRPATPPKVAGLFYLESDTGSLYVVRVNGSAFDWELVATGAGANQTARLASHANVTLATPGANLDGKAMVANDVILLRAQTDATQNGLWIFNGAAVPLTRAPSMPAGDTISAGLLVDVTDGDAWVGSVHVMTSGGIVGTSSLNFVSAARLGSSLSDLTASPVTINALRGRFRIAAGTAATQVNNDLVTATSIVICNQLANDATALRYAVVPGAGSFTVTTNAATTANLDFMFIVFP